MSARKPLLCLDTNASIDIGVVNSLRRKGESLDARSRRIDESWESVFYDEAIKADVAKIFRDRDEQLRGAGRFLDMARDASCIRLPRFVKIEHERVRSDKDSIPPFPVEQITSGVHRVSLKIFSETTLSLADSLVLASAMEMRADAIVSNDDDFRRAFDRHAGHIALRETGKPLLLLDHREPAKFKEEESPTLYSMILRSLRRWYRGHPHLGRPLWVDSRGKDGWYLAYHHPLPAGGFEPLLVPRRDSVSIIDECSWTVCEIGSVQFFGKNYPEGITKDSIEETKKYIEETRVILPKNIERHFRSPEGEKSGHIRVSVALDDLPPSWEGWGDSTGKRVGTKRNAPGNALGFVET